MESNFDGKLLFFAELVVKSVSIEADRGTCKQLTED